MSADGTARGANPVIGVILMIAITVILAAVIGTYVLDIGQDRPEDTVEPVENLTLVHGLLTGEDADECRITADIQPDAPDGGDRIVVELADATHVFRDRGTLDAPIRRGAVVAIYSVDLKRGGLEIGRALVLEQGIVTNRCALVEDVEDVTAASWSDSR